MSLEQAVQDNTAAIRELIQALALASSIIVPDSVHKTVATEVPITPELAEKVREVERATREAMATADAKAFAAMADAVARSNAAGYEIQDIRPQAPLNPAPEPVKPVGITQEVVNAQLKAAMKAKGGPALRALFAEFGVTNFKEITEAQYAPMYAAATKMLEG